MSKARKNGIITPTIFYVDKKNYFYIMEYINGVTMKQFINSYNNKEELINMIKELGRNVAIIHNINIIHGDLTTSNFLVNNNKQIVTIDWGLSYVSEKIEDKCVDLYVLERACNSTHPQYQDLVFIYIFFYSLNIF